MHSHTKLIEVCELTQLPIVSPNQFLKQCQVIFKVSKVKSTNAVNGDLPFLSKISLSTQLEINFSFTEFSQIKFILKVKTMPMFHLKVNIAFMSSHRHHLLVFASLQRILFDLWTQGSLLFEFLSLWSSCTKLTWKLVYRSLKKDWLISLKR